MAKLKDRRAAHRLVAEVLWNFMRKQQPSPVELDAPDIRAEVERIREAHFSAGTIEDSLPDDHEVLEPGALSMGGIYHCNGCNKTLADKTKRLCPECEAKVEPEQKNGDAKPKEPFAIEAAVADVMSRR